MTLESYGPDAPTSTGNVLTGNLDTVWLLSHHLYYQRKDDELSAMSFLHRALEAACAAYASLNLSLLHYITYIPSPAEQLKIELYIRAYYSH